MLKINTVTPEFNGTNFQPNTMAVAEQVNTPNSVIVSDLTKLLDSLNECILIINSPTIQEIDDTIQAIQTRIGDVEDIIEGDVYAPKNHSSSSTEYGLLTGVNYGHVKTIDNLTTTDTDAGKLLSARQGSIIKGLINGLLNDIDVHQNDIDELQNEVNGIQTDINGIRGDIDELQDDINSNTEEGNVIKGLINGLNSEVGGLQNEVGGIQTNISGLQTALDGKVDDSRVLTNVPLNAKFTDTVYNHPSTHPASMITESSTKRFVSDSEKSTWNSKSDTDTVTTINGKTGAISKDDIVALGIPSQDTNTTYSEITTAEIDVGTASTLRTITGRRVKYILDKVQGWISGLTKSDVGLGNVDNTSDASKPISTATQTALNAKANATDLTTHTGSTSNPHAVTKTQVGLGNVDNVKQMPISGGVLENYREKLTTVSASLGGINLNLGNVFVHTPSGNRTYSITNAVSGQAHSFTLIINMGSTVRTLTFPSSVKWQDGEIPDMTTANKTYVLTFLTVDGGTTWLGMFGGEF